MNKARFDSIAKKLENVKTFEDARKRVSSKDLIYFMLNEPFSGIKANILEGDEYIISEIVRLVASKELSFAYSSHLLDVTKDILGYFARVKY